MAIDFPASPTNGQTFVVGTVTYTWDGVKWTALASGGGGGSGDKIEEGNTSAEVIDTGSDGRFVVTTDGSEALRVDSSQRVGIGTTSPSTALDCVGTLRLRNNSSSAVQFYTEAGGAEGHIFYDQANNNLEITNFHSGYINFKTNDTERARIDSSGRLLVGTSIPFGPQGFTVAPNYSFGSASIGFFREINANGSTAVYFQSGANNVGYISYTNSATIYSTSSDYRLKENVTLLTGATDRLKQLPVHRFNFIADPERTVDGFIAHEAQAVVPECVTGEKDEVDDDGNPVYQGIDQSKLVPLLTAALQEAIGRIETLEAKVAALEGASSQPV